MGEQIRIGLIGAGRIGRVHAANLATRIPGAKVAVVCDISKEAAERCAARLGIPAAVNDPERVLERRDVQAVVICSSTDTHIPLIGEAAGAGKHIFCEKPIGFDLAAIDWALAKVKSTGVKLQVGFNRRFDPSFRRVWELVRAGRIGTPQLLRITSRDPSPPPPAYVRVSGGLFLDMTIHDFDMARYLMGCEVEEVYAAGGVLVDPEIGKAGDIDTAVVVLKFDSGGMGTIDNSRKSAFGYDQRVEVFGSLGMAEAGNAFPNTVTLSTAETVGRDLPFTFFMDRYAESFLREMEAFVQCLREGGDPPVSGKDGRVPVAMAKAARLSLERHAPARMAEITV